MTHPTDPGPALDGVLGYHLNPLTCGVAKFNMMFASRLAVPMLNVFDPAAQLMRAPLLSLKISEFDEADSRTLMALVDTAPWRDTFRLFLHAWTDTDLERRLLERAAVVYCGNAELVETLAGARPDVVLSFCPWTLVDPQRFTPGGLSVFSFGMAHKIRADLHDRLHALLDATGQPYSVYLSTALHEGTAFDESFTIAFEELRKIYGDRIYFLGYMSDTAVFNYLHDTTFFAAFFDKGVRANNTTVNAAMECGSVVITNTDRFSPSPFEHMRNMIDIHRCEALPVAPSELEALSTRARETASETLGWDALLARIAEHEAGSRVRRTER